MISHCVALCPSADPPVPVYWTVLYSPPQSCTVQSSPRKLGPALRSYSLVQSQAGDWDVKYVVANKSSTVSVTVSWLGLHRTESQSSLLSFLSVVGPGKSANISHHLHNIWRPQRKQQIFLKSDVQLNFVLRSIEKKRGERGPGLRWSVSDQWLFVGAETESSQLSSSLFPCRQFCSVRTLVKRPGQDRLAVCVEFWLRECYLSERNMRVRAIER